MPFWVHCAILVLPCLRFRIKEKKTMRTMRRKDRELPRELALAVTDKCAYSVLATVNPDGSPYCVPLSFVR